MLDELIFPWCPTCPLYDACYVDDAINFIEEECQFGVASKGYAHEVLADIEKSYIQLKGESYENPYEY